MSLNDLADPRGICLPGIVHVDLHGNKLTDLQVLLDAFPDCQNLSVSSNKIETLNVSPNHILRSLSLAGNNLADLSSISRLEACSKLETLQYTILHDDTDEQTRLQIIKSLPQLKMVNKTNVTQQEHFDAARVGAPIVKTSHSVASNTLLIKLVYEGDLLEKRVLKSQTVRQLKNAYAKAFKLKPTSITKLYLESDGIFMELSNELAQLSFYDISDGVIIRT